MQTMAPLGQEFSTPIPVGHTPTAQYNKAVKDQEASRKVASADADFYESKMSPEYKKFRTEFLKIKTAEELDKKLSELDTIYDSLPASATDLKFVAAQIIPFRVFRGIAWRLIPPMSEPKIVHSAVLTQVKNLAVNTKIFFPTEQWDAGTDYLTQPFVQNGVAPFVKKGEMIKQFPDRQQLLQDKNLMARGSWTGDVDVEAPLQAYVIGVIIPAAEKAADRIEKLDMSRA